MGENPHFNQLSKLINSISLRLKKTSNLTTLRTTGLLSVQTGIMSTQLGDMYYLKLTMNSHI